MSIFRIPNDREKNPKLELYPIPVVEYPVSFLRLHKLLTQCAGLRSDFLIEIQYRNVAGYILPPGAPNKYGETRKSRQTRPFLRQHLRHDLKARADFSPDLSAYEILKKVYLSFGLTEEAIPYFSKAESAFKF
jgi:hypothetical protein